MQVSHDLVAGKCLMNWSPLARRRAHLLWGDRSPDVMRRSIVCRGDGGSIPSFKSRGIVLVPCLRTSPYRNVAAFPRRASSSLPATPCRSPHPPIFLSPPLRPSRLPCASFGRQPLVENYRLMREPHIESESQNWHSIGPTHWLPGSGLSSQPFLNLLLLAPRLPTSLAIRCCACLPPRRPPLLTHVWAWCSRGGLGRHSDIPLPAFSQLEEYRTETPISLCVGRERGRRRRQGGGPRPRLRSQRASTSTWCQGEWCWHASAGGGTRQPCRSWPLSMGEWGGCVGGGRGAPARWAARLACFHAHHLI